METLQEKYTCHGQAAASHPLVSVVMPAYNAGKYIGDAIRSVQAQTYENWELLVIDDCSADHTVEIIQALANEDDRIRLIRNSQNSGTAQTRNHGLELSAGEWVALLDSDDVWHSEKLEKQLAVALRTNADIVYCSYSLMDDRSHHLSDFVIPETTSYRDMLKENVIGCSTVLMRRAILTGRRFSAEYYHEDYVLWLELLRDGYKAAADREVLTDYRIVKGSRSNDKLRSAKNRWMIYRRVEKLSWLKSLSMFLVYAVKGLKKYTDTRQ